MAGDAARLSKLLFEAREIVDMYHWGTLSIRVQPRHRLTAARP